MKKLALIAGLLFSSFNLNPANAQDSDYGIRSVKLYQGALSPYDLVITIDAKSKDVSDWLFLYVKDGDNERPLMGQNSFIEGHCKHDFNFSCDADIPPEIKLKGLEGKTFIVKQYDDSFEDRSKSVGGVEFSPSGEVVDERKGVFPRCRDIKFLEKYE